jgi:hypothetical protein
MPYDEILNVVEIVKWPVTFVVVVVILWHGQRKRSR